ncbi:hypothetical protein [Salinarimonas soli]|uniref:Uncharacterized protein n=1 Tax=Salinarimonas soli TaxID=1638099 RepID=A0A5B2VQ33_9HYPH|nr:hypothetical protein [Salinarimonas soli]KAA2241251.1 hypothetical protein F0L46_04445 [Salinarimonas soli]
MGLLAFLRRARALVVACLLLTLAGAVLLGMAARMPEYTDPTRAAELQNVERPGARTDLDRFSAEWHAEMDRLRTNKWPIHDLGRTLIALAATILVAALLFRAPTPQAFGAITTPRTVHGLLALTASVLAAPIPISVLWFSENQARFSYPTWADSIGLPIGLMTVTVLITGPVAWLAMFLVARGSQPPVRLRVPRGARTSTDRLAEIVCAGVVVCEMLLVLSAISPLYFPVPPFIAALFYIGASGRALRLARKEPSARRSAGSEACDPLSGDLAHVVWA